jgi:hypothetical protein
MRWYRLRGMESGGIALYVWTSLSVLRDNGEWLRVHCGQSEAPNTMKCLPVRTATIMAGVRVEFAGGQLVYLPNTFTLRDCRARTSRTIFEHACRATRAAMLHTRRKKGRAQSASSAEPVTRIRDLGRNGRKLPAGTKTLITQRSQQSVVLYFWGCYLYYTD